MDAILYICHGSRVPKACEQAISFIQKCMERNTAPIQEYCFLELAEPTIEEAYEKCVERGATTIKAIPVLLLTAAHAKEDIPGELVKVQSKFPHVKLQYGRPIGVHGKMVDILIERIQDTNVELTKDSMVLLVGRGSSDPDVKRDLNEIAEMLKSKVGLDCVEAVFLTAASPSFEDGLQLAKESGYKRIFIIPYLLFTGILMLSMQKTIKNFASNDEQEFILCNYLGYHPSIEDMLMERIHELTEEHQYVSYND